MPWIELHLHTTAEYAPHLADQLSLLGAQALTMCDAANQPIYEPAYYSTTLWHETVVVGLFDDQEPMDAILAFIQKQHVDNLLTHVYTKEIADEDWERRCLDSFQPLQFGKRLWICPSWTTPPDPQAINVILDPGLAFGTGTHATTALCLEWLAANSRPGDVVIDYGCGSGILALAALKLGASQVFAIDNDLQALEATQRNGQCNQVIPPLLETYLPTASLPKPADLLVANILAQPLIGLAPLFFSLLKTHGRILLSGILISQAEQVSKAYQPWFDMQPYDYKEEWVRITGVRK